MQSIEKWKKTHPAAKKKGGIKKLMERATNAVRSLTAFLLLHSDCSLISFADLIL